LAADRPSNPPRYSEQVASVTSDSAASAFTLELMTLDELEREYAELRQQAEAVRSYL
jgi:hypothetical protein